MNWVRTNIRLGTRLALIALALHFVVAFGHFHQIVIQSAVLTLTAADPGSPDSDPATDDNADTCTICAVMAMADAILDASPPSLPARQATSFVHRVPRGAVLHTSDLRTAFNPRAPPIG